MNYVNNAHDKNTQLFLKYHKFFQNNIAKGGHHLRAVTACKTGYTFSLLEGRVVTIKEWYEIAEANEKRKEVLKLWRTNHDARQSSNCETRECNARY